MEPDTTLAPDLQAEVDARHAKGTFVPAIGATDTSTRVLVDAAYIRNFLFTTTLKPDADMTHNVGAAPDGWTPRKDPTQETYVAPDAPTVAADPAATTTIDLASAKPAEPTAIVEGATTEIPASSTAAPADPVHEGVDGELHHADDTTAAAAPVEQVPAAHESVVEKIEHAGAEIVHEVEHLVEEGIEKVREVL